MFRMKIKAKMCVTIHLTSKPYLVDCATSRLHIDLSQLLKVSANMLNLGCLFGYVQTH